MNAPPAFGSLHVLLTLSVFAPVAASSQPAELIDLRREIDPEGVRLVMESSARSPLLFDYSSPTLEEIVLLLHDVQPGSLAGISEAWSPEVTLLEAVPEIDSEGRPSTRLSVRLTTFQYYRIRTEGKRLLIVLLGSRDDSRSERLTDPSVAVEAALPQDDGGAVHDDRRTRLADASVAAGTELPHDDVEDAPETLATPSPTSTPTLTPAPIPALTPVPTPVPTPPPPDSPGDRPDDSAGGSARDAGASSPW